MRHFYLLFCFFWALSTSYAQRCGINQVVDIPDNGRSNSLSIEANTTQSGIRTLCAVRLSFEHQFVTEMRFVLVSPSGKRLVLTSGKPSSPNTKNSSWNILFVRPEEVAHPDDFKKPIWQENNWEQDKSYVGSYYPDDAKGLSYFDGENMIGTWNLEYTDLVQGGTGTLKGFGLIFCELPTFCGPCQLSTEFLAGKDFGAYCGGDATLQSVVPTINQSLLQTGFDYMYMVLGAKDQIILRGKSLDMSLLGKGTYKIIAIQFRPENASDLVGINNRKNLEVLFYGSQSKICGAIARNTNTITILSNPGPTLIERKIYGKSSIVIDGQIISSDQLIVQYLKDQRGCDSLIHLQISFKDLMPVFSQDQVYSCNNTSIKLSVTTTPEFPVRRWFTRDGKISNQSKLGSNTITVDAPGTYSVVFEIEDYLDTVDYQLKTEPNTPAITLSNEYIICASQPLKLKIGTNISSASITPSHAATVVGDSLIIRKPDLYTVTVSNGNCPLTSHILVQEKPILENIIIDDAQISCPGVTVDLHPKLPQDYENYVWLYEEDIVGNTKTLSTSQPGYYTFRAFNGNECGASGTAWIEDNIENVNLSITGPDIINCSNKDKTNRLTAVFQGDFTVTWTLPDGSHQTGDDVVVAGDGVYRAEITDDFGCTFTTEKSVITDTTFIDFKVPDEIIIPCIATSATIEADVTSLPEEYTISWNGASVTSSKSSAIVHSPGAVIVTVTDKISLCKNTKEIRVQEDNGKPRITFDSSLDRSISCTNPIKKIPFTIENCIGCIPDKITNDNIVLENSEITANEPGTIILQLDNGTCVNSQTLTFPDKTKPASPKINLENIGCSGQEGVIEITNYLDYSFIELHNTQDTIPYTGIIRNIKSPVDYHLVYTDKTNGCTGSMPISIKNISTAPTVDYEPVHYLDCNFGTAELTLSGKNINDIVWFGPSGNQLAEKSNSLLATSAGRYRFIAYNKELCYQDKFIEVIDDRSIPTLGLKSQYELPCDSRDMGIKLSYDTSKIKAVSWYGPQGWRSDQFFPGITEPGTYRIRIEAINGCTNTESILVVRQDFGTVPEIIAPPITCRNSFSRVYLSDYSSIQSLQWIDESGQASLSDTFAVYNPGKISLTMRKTNGCQYSVNRMVEEDQELVSFEINKPIIDCHQLQPEFKVKTAPNVVRPIFYQWFFEGTPVGQQSTYKIKYPGDYQVKVSYDNGCIDSLSHTVKLDTTPVDFQVLPDTINCSRSKIQLREDISTKQLATAQWTGPDNYYSKALRPNFQIPGIYKVQYTGQNGCIGHSALEIFGDLDPPLVDSVKFPSLGCGGKEVDLTYFSSDSITTQYWQMPNGEILERPDVQIYSKGDYLLYLEKSNGCSIIDTIQVDKSISPRFELDISDAGCEIPKGKALLLPEQDTFIAIWQEPGTLNELGRGKISPNLAPGSYLVTVRNPLNGCDSTTSFEIRDISSLLEASISIDDSIRCERNTANLLSSIHPPSENYTFEWRFGTNPTIFSRDSMATAISDEGYYYLTATDSVNKCSTQAQFLNVRARSTLRSFDLLLTEPACDLNKPGFAIVDSLIGAHDMSLLTYSMNEGPFIKRDTFPFLYANQSYSLSARDEYGCTLDTVLMPILRGVMGKLNSINDTTINGGDKINLNDPAFKIVYDSPDAPLSEQYTWILNPDTLRCDFDCAEEIEMQLFQTRSITAILTNVYGCSIKDTFQVFVREGDVLNLPNGIIPASSQPENAHACIYTNEYVENIEMYIVFNPVGSVVFKQTNFKPGHPTPEIRNCWNGRDSQNNILPQGNYNYYVRYKTVYGASKERYGNIFLLR